MAGEPGPLPLAADFPAPTRAEWRALVAAVLAKSGVTGDDPERALSHTTYDGIRIHPLYTAEDAHDVDRDGLPGHPAFVRGATEAGATLGPAGKSNRHAGRERARFAAPFPQVSPRVQRQRRKLFAVAREIPRGQRADAPVGRARSLTAPTPYSIVSGVDETVRV